MSGTTDARTSLVVNGVTIETIERGRGRPILFLHPNIGIEPDAPVLDALAKGGRVIAPTHPGFGTSQLPKGMTRIDDLSYFYLDLMEQLDLRDMLLVGVGIGGWLACEIAVKTTERIDRLVLGNPLGIKVGDRETRDIFDIWSITQTEIDALAYFDPSISQARLQQAARGRRARRRAQPRSDRAGRMVAVHAQSQAQGAAAPHRRSGADPVGHSRPRRPQSGIWTRVRAPPFPARGSRPSSAPATILISSSRKNSRDARWHSPNRSSQAKARA